MSFGGNRSIHNFMQNLPLDIFIVFEYLDLNSFFSNFKLNAFFNELILNGTNGFLQASWDIEEIHFSTDLLDHR